MVKQFTDERREYIRAKRILSVRHRLVKRKNKPMYDFWYLSTTEDMSVNGLLFTSAMPYQKFDIVELEIVMSGVLDIFRGFGKVVRVQKKESGAFYSVAVQYIDIKARRTRAVGLSTRRNRVRKIAAKRK